MRYIRLIRLLPLFAMAVHGVFIVTPILNQPIGSPIILEGLYNVVAAFFGFILIVVATCAGVLFLAGIVSRFVIWLFKIDQ